MKRRAATPEQVLTIDVRPSRILRLLEGVVCVLAGFAVLLSGLNWAVWVPILAALLITAAGVFRARPQNSFRLGSDGVLDMKIDGAWQELTLLPSTVVLAGCVLLAYRREARAGMEGTVVLPDSLDPDDFRRLRVWLRWRPGGA